MYHNMTLYLHDEIQLESISSTAVEDVDPDIDIFQWWKNHEEDLFNCASAFKAIILGQPSSAEFTHQPLKDLVSCC